MPKILYPETNLSNDPRTFRSAVLAAFLFLGSPDAFAGPYTVELVALPTAHTAIDFRLSSNDRGQVGFAGTDATDNFSKAFFWNCVGDLVGPCNAPAAASFFGSGRTFSGAAVSSAVTPEVASRDTVSGAPPRQFIRKWNQGAFVELGDSGSPDLTFGAGTGFLSINTAGNVVAATADGSFNPQVQFFVGDNPAGSATAEGASLTIPLSAGAIARPQLAQSTDKFVMKFLSGVDSGTGADEIAVVDSLGQKTLVTRDSQTGLNPFSNLGDIPGISEEGDVVAFAGTRTHPTLLSATRGIHLWVKTLNQTSMFTAVWEGSGAITSLLNSLTNRVAVIARKGPTGIDPVTKKPRHYQLVSVAFIADAPTSGVYSIDLLLEVFENYIPMSNPAVDYVKLVGVSKLTSIAKAGDVIGSATLTGNFATWGPFLMLRGGDVGRSQDDTLRPVIAFSAEIAGPKRVVLRAMRNCAVDAAATLTSDKQILSSWSPTPLETSPGGNPIGDVGCTLTNTSNVLNYFIGSHALDPGLANQVFSNKPFLVQSGVPVIQSSRTPGTRSVSALIAGDMDIATAAGLMGAYGQSLGYLAVDENLLPAYPGSASLPTPSATVADEPLSPVIDFFLCNGEPVIVKVFNCKSASSGGPYTCTGHYVTAKNKAIFTSQSDSLGASSYAINDPGYINATELLNKFPKTNGFVYRANRVAGVRALTRLDVAGMVKVPGFAAGRLLSVTVLSPVDLRITDPLGRAVDLRTSGPGLSEIPNAYVSDDAFTDPEGTIQAGHARHLVIGGQEDALGIVQGQGGGLVDGVYTIDVAGTGAGPFLIRVLSQESDGNLRARLVRGTASVGYTDVITFSIATAPGQLFKLARASLPSPASGDVDLNGTVDGLDLTEIQQAVGGNSDGPGDPRDVDGDGTVTQADVDAVQQAPVATLDVDASITATKYDALTDGLIVIRYLFGLTGESLTTGALGGTATRMDPAAVKVYLDGIRSALDIDGNGTPDALTDGMLVLRYLFGLRGASLITGAFDPMGSRTSPEAIGAHIETLMP